MFKNLILSSLFSLSPLATPNYANNDVGSISNDSVLYKPTNNNLPSYFKLDSVIYDSDISDSARKRFNIVHTLYDEFSFYFGQEREHLTWKCTTVLVSNYLYKYEYYTSYSSGRYDNIFTDKIWEGNCSFALYTYFECIEEGRVYTPTQYQYVSPIKDSISRGGARYFYNRDSGKPWTMDVLIDSDGTIISRAEIEPNYLLFNNTIQNPDVDNSFPEIVFTFYLGHSGTNNIVNYSIDLENPNFTNLYASRIGDIQNSPFYFKNFSNGFYSINHHERMFEYCRGIVGNSAFDKFHVGIMKYVDISSDPIQYGPFEWIKSAFNAVGAFFNISIGGFITIGTLFAIPLCFIVLLFIIKLLGGGD